MAKEAKNRLEQLTSEAEADRYSCKYSARALFSDVPMVISKNTPEEIPVRKKKDDARSTLLPHIMRKSV